MNRYSTVAVPVLAGDCDGCFPILVNSDPQDQDPRNWAGSLLVCLCVVVPGFAAAGLLFALDRLPRGKGGADPSFTVPAIGLFLAVLVACCLFGSYLLASSRAAGEQRRGEWVHSFIVLFCSQFVLAPGFAYVAHSLFKDML